MIGILFESDEWSDYKLAAEIRNFDVETKLINMQDPACQKAALACSLLVSRVFASAQFRNHEASLARMPSIIEAAGQHGIPLLNPGRAHLFETDKRLATKTLADAGFVTPVVQACGKPEDLDPAAFDYPCIIKPNCGGRTTYTAIARTLDEARAFLKSAPAIAFVVQGYVYPLRGFLTRIEIVDGACVLVVKRSIAENGLSAYHLGSTYQLYDDCKSSIKRVSEQAARTLEIELGSFDIIESQNGPCIIDANSVSNVSEDCTELFGLDLMAAHARAIVRRYRAIQVS